MRHLMIETLHNPARYGTVQEAPWMNREGKRICGVNIPYCYSFIMRVLTPALL